MSKNTGGLQEDEESFARNRQFYSYDTEADSFRNLQNPKRKLIPSSSYYGQTSSRSQILLHREHSKRNFDDDMDVYKIDGVKRGGINTSYAESYMGNASFKESEVYNEPEGISQPLDNIVSRNRMVISNQAEAQSSSRHGNQRMHAMERKRKTYSMKNEEYVDSMEGINDDEVVDVISNEYERLARPLTKNKPVREAKRKIVGYYDNDESIERSNFVRGLNEIKDLDDNPVIAYKKARISSNMEDGNEDFMLPTARNPSGSVGGIQMQSLKQNLTTAPLLTTDRTKTRSRRSKQEKHLGESNLSKDVEVPTQTKDFQEPQEAEWSQYQSTSEYKEPNSETQLLYRRTGRLSEFDDEDLKNRNHIILLEEGEEYIYEPVNEEDEELMEQLNEDNLLYVDTGLEESVEEVVDQSEQFSSPKVGIKEKNDITENMVIDDPEDAPPELIPEEGPCAEEILQLEELERDALQETEYIEGVGEVVRVEMPGGTQQFIHLSEQMVGGTSDIGDDVVYVDENGMVLEEPPQQDLRAIEFNFLDSKNICCGLCGEIVPYDLLMSEHLPTHHPEMLDANNMGLEEVPYESWLKDKLSYEKKSMESGFRPAYDLPRSNRNRTLRKVSQVRVNPNEMTLAQLDVALKKKMYEKLGRRVPVNLVDKQHARCGMCKAIVSLNRKFEVVHLVRHFNAWHPSSHQCTGTWKDRHVQPDAGKPLSMHDFSVVSTSSTGDNLQCIWCGMLMCADTLAMHFSEIHPDDVEIPKCNLCLQELVINACLKEKYNENFDISLPDERHFHCGKFAITHSTEADLRNAISKLMSKQDNDISLIEKPKSGSNSQTEGLEPFLNSRMQFGRRSKPKRHFIMPALRQAVPTGSKYIEYVDDSHWRCRMCRKDIMAAVMSAGAIRHYRSDHIEHLGGMQYELCKARLERVSDGCMEFIDPNLIECLLCNMTYMLHKPYNMCRAIRHLKSKHSDVMPEYAGVANSKSKKNKITKKQEQTILEESLELGNYIDQNGYVTDPKVISVLKVRYGVDFDKVHVSKGSDGQQVFLLLSENEEINPETLEEIASVVKEGDPNTMQVTVNTNELDKHSAELPEENCSSKASQQFANNEEFAEPETSLSNTYFSLVESGNTSSELDKSEKEGRVSEDSEMPAEGQQEFSDRTLRYKMRKGSKP